MYVGAWVCLCQIYIIYSLLLFNEQIVPFRDSESENEIELLELELALALALVPAGLGS